MSPTTLMTLTQNWQRARRTNTTDNGFPSRIARATEPTGVGDAAAQTTSAVWDIANNGNCGQNGIVVKPYGAGANNNTLSVRIIGWTKIIEQGDETTASWEPTLLAEIACTLSSTPIGLAGKLVVATDLFADTITLTYGNDNITISRMSPANDLAGHVTIDLEGAQKVELTFTTGGSATNCNALIRYI